MSFQDAYGTRRHLVGWLGVRIEHTRSVDEQQSQQTKVTPGKCRKPLILLSCYDVTTRKAVFGGVRGGRLPGLKKAVPGVSWLKDGAERGYPETS